MTQAVAHKSFRGWFAAGFGAETLPIIPPDAVLTPGSTVQLKHRGKTPGVLTHGGTWSGLGGQWSENLHATVSEAKQWAAWGASVGLQSRSYPGLDIDVEDAAVAAAIEELAFDYLGFAPLRVRPGSPRRLLVYKRPADHAPIRKTRVAWTDAAGTMHAVELLAHGQQYVVEGPHPKGGAYEWRNDESPCNAWGPDKITEISSEHIAAFFAALVAAIDTNKWGTLSRDILTHSGSAPGVRKKLDNPELHAPNAEMVMEALQHVPCNGATFPSRDSFVQFLAAVRASLGPRGDEFWPNVLEWALGFEGSEESFIAKIWDSLNDAALGWGWLAGEARKHGGFSADAQEDFADSPEPEAPAAVAAPQNDDTATETPLARMVRKFVWVQQLERYVNMDTCATLSGRAFNAANVAVAEFGKSGVQSAEATFQNSFDSKKAEIATYRPGLPSLVLDENQSGVRVRAVNLWRASNLAPVPSTDEDVAPWLAHVDAIFGPVGDRSREHILDWCAFVIQNPGKKINHALVILGEQGVGKDTAFVPVLEAIGRANVSTIKTETLIGQWTHFLLAQVVVVQEMMNFQRRELYNKLKDLTAAPPYYLEVNRKNLNQFMVPNIQNWIVFTNHDDAIALDPDDRRFFVHQSNTETPFEEGYYMELYEWFRTGGSAKVAGWLAARDVSAFNPAARPPKTEAKAAMIDAALPAAVRWLGELFEDGGIFEGRELMTAKEMLSQARGLATPQIQNGVREKHAVAALKRAGYVSVGVKVRLSDGSTVRPWTSGAAHLMAQLSHSRLVERYEGEAAANDAKRRGA